jgi:hypothetical protein
MTAARLALLAEALARAEREHRITSGRVRHSWARVTPRDAEVARVVLACGSMNAAARTLAVTAETISNHCHRLLWRHEKNFRPDWATTPKRTTTMTTRYTTHGLYAWTIELADGSVRHVLASSLQTAIFGVLPSPVVKAERGIASEADVTPVLTSLVPPTAVLGGPNFTLHVHGTGFGPGAVILWNGSPEPTTFVSPTELTTGVDMTTAAIAAAIPVTVRTITELESNALAFTLTEAADAPPADPTTQSVHA